MKLLARTTVFFLIYASVVAVGGTFVYYGFIRKIYYAYVDRTLSRRKLRVDKALRLHLRTPADLAFWHQLDHNVEFTALPAPGPPARFSERMMFNELTGRMTPYRQLAAPVQFRGRPYRLELRTTMLDSQELLARIVLAGALLFGALLVGLLGLQHVLARRLWAPFYHTLGELKRYKLDQPQTLRLAPTRIPEFQELNAALGRVLSRNQRVYHRQKEFTENAAHELQTPLTILRTNLDMLVQAPGLTEEQAGHIEPLLAVTQRLTHLSRSLLLLANLDQQLFFPRETVNLAAVVRTQLGQLPALGIGGSLALRTDLAPTLPLAANRALLDILVSNLLSNAIRHNVPGGEVRVTLTPQLLSISNTGRTHALPADQLFVRFRPGTLARQRRAGPGHCPPNLRKRGLSAQLPLRGAGRPHHARAHWVKPEGRGRNLRRRWRVRAAGPFPTPLMIVNPTPAGWQIIYQQAHALLAAQLMWQWPPLGPTDRFVGLLAAVTQHDDEQAAWHGRGGHYGLTPAGAPANFTQKEFSREQAQGLLAAARFQGRWRSLLTSMHLSVLYESLRGQKKETDGFLDELRAGQEAWRRGLKINKRDAQQAYDLLHWCDRLSLILCRQEIPEMGRAVEIYHGPDGTTHTLSQPEPGGPVVVSPWPFRDEAFSVSVEASTLGQLQFRDDAELAGALRAAPAETLRWELCRAPGKQIR